MKPKPMQYDYYISPRTEKAYTQHRITGENKIVKFCYKCGAVYAPEIKIESLMEDPWYGATKEHYQKCYYCGSELSEKPFDGSEEFDINATIKRDQIEEENENHDLEELECLANSTPIQPSQANIPKCPTCDSTDVKKLSTTSKVIGISLLGLASKTVGKTYKCNKCGYYW